MAGHIGNPTGEEPAHLVLDAQRDRYWLLILVHFGIKPWEIDRLAVVEFELLCKQADQIESERKAADRG